MANPMECHCIPPSEIPHQTLLYTTYLTDPSRLRDFYPHLPDEKGILRAAEQVRYDSATRKSVVEVLREQNHRLGSGAATSRNLDRFADGAFAVVAGQQVGLFTGPSYSIYKALAAIRIARQLSEQGTSAVPIFWMATEDHDLAEIQHSDWLGTAGIERLELAPAVPAGPRVGEISLGANISALVDRACDLLEGPSAEALSRALKESYTPAENFGSAFGKLMARLLAKEGLILLDPLDVRLHRLSMPIYLRAIDEHAQLASDLSNRSKQLQKSRYHVQVKVSESSTLLFLSRNGHRLPIRRRNNGFAAGDTHLTNEDLIRTLREHPEDFSANALLRPVVQDALLPTAAFIAGPAEIVYLAQSEVLYRKLLGRMPAVLPRASFTLVEPRVARLLKKYGLELRSLFGGRQALRGAMERRFLTRALAKRFDLGETSLRRTLAGMRKPLGKLDRTLVGSLATAERKMLYQLGRLRGKAARAENFRTGILDSHERLLTDALYPHRGLQERTLCLLPMLAKYGPELLDELSGRATIGNTQHNVLYL
jgi:bacillithiol biosynthesis cysteine-adding enzyme BshC